jgi:hypothetical protein
MERVSLKARLIKWHDMRCVCVEETSASCLRKFHWVRIRSPFQEVFIAKLVFPL